MIRSIRRNSKTGATADSCKRDKMVAKFWLDPIVLERGGRFKPDELNKIGKLVQENRELFLEKWYEHFGN
jgi:hypothetical protein